jgi:hypothetical protein
LSLNSKDGFVGGVNSVGGIPPPSPANRIPLIDLREAIKSTCAKLEEQVWSCQMGKLKVVRVNDGIMVDATPEHIKEIKRQIAEYDRVLDHLAAPNA